MIENVQNHPLWIIRRDQYLKDYGTGCVSCGTKLNPHVHHKCYQNGRAYWDYPDEYLEVLCKKCHAEFHTTMPITKLYTLGYKIPPKISTMKMSKEIEIIRRLVIKKSYTPEMAFNLYATDNKTIYIGQITELEFIFGLCTADIIYFLEERGITIEHTVKKKIKKPKKVAVAQEPVKKKLFFKRLVTV
jgi:hypothetical protein